MLARYFRVADAAMLIKENNIIIIKNKSTAGCFYSGNNKNKSLHQCQWF